MENKSFNQNSFNNIWLINKEYFCFYMDGVCKNLPEKDYRIFVDCDCNNIIHNSLYHHLYTNLVPAIIERKYCG